MMRNEQDVVAKVSIYKNPNPEQLKYCLISDKMNLSKGTIRQKALFRQNHEAEIKCSGYKAVCHHVCVWLKGYQRSPREMGDSPSQALLQVRWEPDLALGKCPWQHSLDHPASVAEWQTPRERGKQPRAHGEAAWKSRLHGPEHSTKRYPKRARLSSEQWSKHTQETQCLHHAVSPECE